jgi:hypothetical protein
MKAEEANAEMKEIAMRMMRSYVLLNAAAKTGQNMNDQIMPLTLLSIK